VLKVKTYLLRYLPVYKFTEGPTDSDLVTSIYFDSPRRALYEGRLKKFDGAIALRVRWYGTTPTDEQTVFMERKVHREDWFGDGRASAKERFPLRSDEVGPLLNGSLSPSELGSRLEARKFKGSVADAVELATEVQTTAARMQLRPSLRTHYLRTAFQRTGDASVRVSLDTDLCMAAELCSAHEWRRSDPLTSLSQLTHFPHAVLEVKLQLASGITEPPAWVQELLNSGCLIEAPKFSKFVHGTAALYTRNPSDGFRPVRELPYWWAPEVKEMWENTSGKNGLLRKEKDNGASGDGALVRHRSDEPLLLWLRDIIETIIACGSKPPTPQANPNGIDRMLSPLSP
jgi:SPX domain protein involved in polyphosphate accumulation